MPTLLLLLAAMASEPPGGAMGRAAEELAARAAEGAEPAKVALAVLERQTKGEP